MLLTFHSQLLTKARFTLSINDRSLLLGALVATILALPCFVVCVIFPPLCLDVRTYKKYVRDISNESISTVEESMHHAREEVRKLNGTSLYGIADILVSCDGTWQKRGFSLFLGWFL